MWPEIRTMGPLIKEPPNKGQVGAWTLVHYSEVVLYWGGFVTATVVRYTLQGRCPLLGVSVIGGSTVHVSIKDTF